MSPSETLPDYELLEPIPLSYGYFTIFLSVVLFQVVNQVVLKFGRPPTKEKDEWKWRNLVVSWIHACIVGTWDLSCFYFYPELVTDLIAYHNLYLYAMVAFSTGYFVHDFIDIVVNKKLIATWEVIPHHFAVAGMFFYNVVTSRCISYNVVALLAEVNTIFLHARKLLQMSCLPFSHPVYRANAGANLVTFVLCRFGGLVWIVGGMFVWGARVTPVYFYILGTSMFVMWVTNIMLFRRLVLSDLVRPWYSKYSKGDREGLGGKRRCSGDENNGGRREKCENGGTSEVIRSSDSSEGRREIAKNGDVNGIGEDMRHRM